MSAQFEPGRGLIVLAAEISGPSGSGLLRLALDTGATSTIINVGILVAIGYDPALASDRVQVTTGSGVEFAPRIAVARIKMPGPHERNLSGSCSYAASASVDGLLGLDFFRDSSLTIDFRAGNIRLA